MLSGRCGVAFSIHPLLPECVDWKRLCEGQKFQNAQIKMVYAYILTPAGLNLKTELTLAFLKRKQAEYEALQRSRRWRGFGAVTAVGGSGPIIGFSVRMIAELLKA